MKLAWLVWEFDDDREPRIVFENPDRWYHRVVPIVYAVIEEGGV